MVGCAYEFLFPNSGYQSTAKQYVAFVVEINPLTVLNMIIQEAALRSEWGIGLVA